MSDAPKFEQPTRIYLQPWCGRCEGSVFLGDGRQWCVDDTWGPCGDCGQQAVAYDIAPVQLLSVARDDEANG
jgi:hypothetical protein